MNLLGIKPYFRLRQISNSHGPRILFFFFLFLLLLSRLSYAQAGKEYTVSQVIGEAEYVLLVEEADGYQVEKRGLLEEGQSLPERYCTVCVPGGSTAVLKDEEGKETEFLGPDVFDLWLIQHRPYAKERVQVTEGTVAVQHSILVDGKRKPVGAPTIVTPGRAVETDPCFKAILFEFSEELVAGEAVTAAAARESLSDPTEDPLDEEPDGGPSS